MFGLRPVLITAATLLSASVASAGIHTWDVSEVFSNHDGSIQFVELVEAAGSPGETGVGNGSITSDTQSHSWSNGAVASPTSNKHYLIATAAFAALPGAPTPDVILPAGVVPFFATTGDTVDFVIYDMCTFPALPNNGTDAYDCVAAGTAVNSPTNYAGTTGSVVAGGAPLVAPTMSPPVVLFMTTVMVLGGSLLIRARGRRA